MLSFRGQSALLLVWGLVRGPNAGPTGPSGAKLLAVSWAGKYQPNKQTYFTLYDSGYFLHLPL